MTTIARIKARRLPSRVAGRRASNLVGAIEGTIVATAVVAGLSESSVPSFRALWILVATGTFFWVAHVYADLLAARIKGHHRMSREAVTEVMAREWPLLQASLLLAVPLVLGVLDILSRDAALGLSILVGVTALIAWGIVFSRREGHGVAGIVGAASMNAAVGLVIVSFKVAVP